jgi:hypothetical protein
MEKSAAGKQHIFRNAEYAGITLFMVGLPCGCKKAYCGNPQPTGGIDSGMPTAPELPSFMVACSPVGA